MKKLLILFTILLAGCGEDKEKPAIVMFGDSHMEIGDWQKLTRHCEVFKVTMGGSTTADVLARVGEVKNKSPTVVFVMAGINDIFAKVPTEKIISNLQEIKSKIGGDIKFFPVMPMVKERGMEDEISALNSQIYEKFTTIPAAPISENGYMLSKYSLDGLHLNKRGYKKWYPLMRDEFRKICDH